MKFNKIEEIKVWQESVDLVERLYLLIKKSKGLAKDYGLRDQIQKSAISIPSNVAEGYERESNQEFIRFLYIAKGSCGELRTQMYIAFRLKYFGEEDFKVMDVVCRKISGMLMNLIKTLKLSNF